VKTGRPHFEDIRCQKKDRLENLIPKRFVFPRWAMLHMKKRWTEPNTFNYCENNVDLSPVYISYSDYEKANNIEANGNDGKFVTLKGTAKSGERLLLEILDIPGIKLSSTFIMMEKSNCNLDGAKAEYDGVLIERNRRGNLLAIDITSAHDFPFCIGILTNIKTIDSMTIRQYSNTYPHIEEPACIPKSLWHNIRTTSQNKNSPCTSYSMHKDNAIFCPFHAEYIGPFAKELSNGQKPIDNPILAIDDWISVENFCTECNICKSSSTGGSMKKRSRRILTKDSERRFLADMTKEECETEFMEENSAFQKIIEDEYISVTCRTLINGRRILSETDSDDYDYYDYGNGDYADLMCIFYGICSDSDPIMVEKILTYESQGDYSEGEYIEIKKQLTTVLNPEDVETMFVVPVHSKRTMKWAISTDGSSCQELCIGLKMNTMIHKIPATKEEFLQIEIEYEAVEDNRPTKIDSKKITDYCDEISNTRLWEAPAMMTGSDGLTICSWRSRYRDYNTDASGFATEERSEWKRICPCEEADKLL